MTDNDDDRSRNAPLDSRGEAVGPPVDAEEERQRLIADATEEGVDPDEALRLAQTLSAGQPDAQALRFVDRRLATGYTLEDAAAIAGGETPPSDAAAHEDSDG